MSGVALAEAPSASALAPDEIVRQSFELAVKAHRAGDFTDAEKLYRAILAYRPDHPDSLHGLGVLAHQVARSDIAVQLIEMALAQRAEPTFHNNHALVLLALDRPHEALAAVYRGLELRPDYPEAQLALGNIQQKLGLRGEAIESYRRALALRPSYAEAQANLAKALMEARAWDEAQEACEKAVALDPACAEAHNTQGNLLRARGRLDEAMASLDRAIALRPAYAEALNNKAVALAAMKKFDEALEAARRAVQCGPELAAAHATYGGILFAKDRYEDSLPHFARALALDPDYLEAHNNRGAALLRLDRVDEAIAAYDRAIELSGEAARGVSYFNLATELLRQFNPEKAVAQFGKALAANPDIAGAQNNLAVAMQNLGKIDEALEGYARAIEIDPHYAAAYSNRLMAMQYSERHGNEEALVTARAYGAAFDRPDPRVFEGRDLSPKRRLRVGYVSGDFNAHPVGFFSYGAIRAHDPALVESFCYYNCTLDDECTRQFRAVAAHWRAIHDKSDAEVADLVRADQIDILVDLSGHTNKTRLAMFGLRPAPIQVHWVGYTGTTGLPSMDYLILDPISAPAGVDRFYTEKLVRLPFGRFCYTATAPDAPLAEPPCLTRGFVTFGSFNNVTKMTPAVVALWARVLGAVPDSRLVLKSRALSEAGLCESLRASFADHGVAPEKLDLRGATPYGAMLAEYGDIDIALDPFPFGGATTTCDALWMGVPVVNFPSDRLASRQTLSFLHYMGLDANAFSAASAEDYVAKAAALAAAPESLKTLRPLLRRALAEAPFSDSTRFARGLESAFGAMWRRHVAGESPQAFDVAPGEAMQ